MAQQKFTGYEQVSRTQYPYGLITGDVAVAVSKYFDRIVEEKDLVKAGYAVKDVPKVIKNEDNPAGVLVGSTPDVNMVLANFVQTDQYGFKVITPQQFAEVYNTNPDFIRDNFWADIQMIRDPTSDLSKKYNRVPWMIDLGEQVREIFRNEFVAIPYAAVIPAEFGNGHLGNVRGYKLNDKAKNLLKVLKWTSKMARGFKFNRFDTDTGVPIQDSAGERTFGGLTGKPISALYVYGSLNANGSRGFDSSFEDGRVVGYSIGEADAKK